MELVFVVKRIDEFIFMSNYFIKLFFKYSQAYFLGEFNLVFETDLLFYYPERLLLLYSEVYLK